MHFFGSVKLRGEPDEMRRKVLLVAWVACVLTAACGDKTGPTLPDPVPDPARLRATAIQDSGAVELVGLPGALPGAGDLVVESSRGRFQARSTSAGSFALVVPVMRAETLRLRFEGGGEIPYAVGTAEPSPTPAVMQPSLSGGGSVTVGVAATPGATVLAVNFSTGEIWEARADAMGRVSITFRAASGEEVHLYADGQALSDPVVYTGTPGL